MYLRAIALSVVCVCCLDAQFAGSGAGIGPGPRQRMSRNAGGNAQAAEVPQGPPASVAGAVFNAATGEPLRRVNIVLMSAQGGPNLSSYSTTTDANGQFAMKDIAAGSYRLMAERNGFVRTDFNARGGNARGAATVISLAPGQELQQVEVRMQPHAVIAGRVVDEEGEPLAGVQVQAMALRYMRGRRQLMHASGASTNDLGEYRIFGIPAGKYYVSANHQPSRMMFPGTVDRTANPNNSAADEGYAPTYYPGTTDTSAAIVIPVTAGQPVGNIDLKLQRVRTVRVSGKVVGPTTPGRTTVMLTPQNDGGPSFGPRNVTPVRAADGGFEMRGVIPGTYALVAQHMEQGSQSTARMTLNVGNSHVENLELMLRPGLQVNGQVKIEAAPETDVSQLYQQISLNLQPSDFGPFATMSNSRVNGDGSFSLTNVFSNKYRVVAMGGVRGLYVKSVKAGDQELPNNEIEIEGAAPNLTVIMGVATAQASGQVKADKPEAAQGVTVVLIPPSDKMDRMDLFRTATSDQNGKFSLSAIPPGDYTAYAWDNVEPGAWQDPDFLKLFDGKGKKISLKDNETATLELSVLPGDPSQN